MRNARTRVFVAVLLLLAAAPVSAQPERYSHDAYMELVAAHVGSLPVITFSAAYEKHTPEREHVTRGMIYGMVGDGVVLRQDMPDGGSVQACRDGIAFLFDETELTLRIDAVGGVAGTIPNPVLLPFEWLLEDDCPLVCADSTEFGQPLYRKAGANAELLIRRGDETVRVRFEPGTDDAGHPPMPSEVVYGDPSMPRRTLTFEDYITISGVRVPLTTVIRTDGDVETITVLPTSIGQSREGMPLLPRSFDDRWKIIWVMEPEDPRRADVRQWLDELKHLSPHTAEQSSLPLSSLLLTSDAEFEIAGELAAPPADLAKKQYTDLLGVRPESLTTQIVKGRAGGGCIVRYFEFKDPATAQAARETLDGARKGESLAIDRYLVQVSGPPAIAAALRAKVLEAAANAVKTCHAP